MNHDVTNPEYSDELRVLETTDPVHADVFNVLFRRLIRNDAKLKEQIDNKDFDFATDEEFAEAMEDAIGSGGSWSPGIPDEDMATDEEVDEIIDGFFPDDWNEEPSEEPSEEPEQRTK